VVQTLPPYNGTARAYTRAIQQELQCPCLSKRRLCKETAMNTTATTGGSLLCGSNPKDPRPEPNARQITSESREASRTPERPLHKEQAALHAPTLVAKQRPVPGPQWSWESQRVGKPQ